MMVDVVAGMWVDEKVKTAPIVKSMPIINLDSGNGIVYHFIDSPPWRASDWQNKSFTVSTTPGNSFNVNFPILTITIRKHENSMYTEVNFPRLGAMGPYEACKIRDLYDELDIRPKRRPYN
jgi:hypothetical protein